MEDCVTREEITPQVHCRARFVPGGLRGPPGHSIELFDKVSVKHGGGKTTELLCNKLWRINTGYSGGLCHTGRNRTTDPL